MDNPLGAVPSNGQPALPNLPPPTAEQPQLAAQPPAAPPANPAAVADVAHHSMLGKAFRSIMGNDVSYSVDPQTGQLAQTSVPQKPGQLWRSLLAGVILGGGTAARNKAPGFAQGAAEGGEAVLDDKQKQDLVKRQQARQQFEDQMKAEQNQRAERSAQTEDDLRKAQIQFHNAQTLHENKLMQREDYAFHENVAKIGKTQLQPFIDADPALVKFKDIPETQMNDILQNNPNAHGLLWEPTGTQIMFNSDGLPNVVATYSAVDPKGEVKVTDAQVNQWKEAGLDQIYGKQTWDVLKKDKKLPASTYMAINQKAQELTNRQLSDKKNKLDADKEEAAIGLAKAQKAEAYARANELNASAAEKQNFEDAYLLFSEGKKLSGKQAAAMIKGITGIISTNNNELRALPKDQLTGQPLDQDKAKELYGTMEDYQKILDQVFKIPQAAKPAGGGTAAPGTTETRNGVAMDTQTANVFDGQAKAGNKPSSWGDIDSIPAASKLTQKLMLAKAYGITVPYDAIEDMSKTLNQPVTAVMDNLKIAGVKYETSPQQKGLFGTPAITPGPK